MIERVTKNEERLDKLIELNNELSLSIDKYNSLKKEIAYLKKYYGSSNWLKDKEYYESNNIKVKAGVLSEDGVWNALEDLDYLIKEMNEIVSKYNKKKQ